MKKLSWNRKVALVLIAVIIGLSIYSISNPISLSPTPQSSGVTGSGSKICRTPPPTGSGVTGSGIIVNTGSGTVTIPPVPCNRCSPLDECSKGQDFPFCCYDHTKPGAKCTADLLSAQCTDDRCKIAPNTLICEGGVIFGGVQVSMCCNADDQLCTVDSNFFPNCELKCSKRTIWGPGGSQQTTLDTECYGSGLHSREFVCCSPDKRCFVDRYGVPSCAMTA